MIFLELTFCNLCENTPIEKILENEYLPAPWRNSLLYIYGDDFNEFYLLYNGIMKDGLYTNLKHGSIDMCGITYFSKKQTQNIIEQLKIKKPRDYEFLLNFLNQREEHNGFYILGL